MTFRVGLVLVMLVWLDMLKLDFKFNLPRVLKTLAEAVLLNEALALPIHQI